MKCMMSSDGTRIVRVSDEEASKLYHNENFKYIAKSVWKEKVRDIEQPQEKPTNKKTNLSVIGSDDIKDLKITSGDSDGKMFKPLFRNQENVKFVLEAMFASTNEVRGTSYSSRIEDKKYQFAGKTGTSQVKRITEAQRELDLDISQIPYEDRDHALYIAFGPYKNPRYAMSIFIEHGGSGGSTAAPMAKKLFKVVIDRHEEREKFKQKNINFVA